MKSRIKQEGFALVETIFSLVIISMVLGGAYQVLSQAFFMTRSSMDHYQAVSIAQNRIERIRKLPPADIPLAVETNNPVDVEGNDDKDSQFRRTTTVVDTASADVKRVTVTVEIKNPRTNQFEGRTETITTMITNYPLREAS